MTKTGKVFECLSKKGPETSLMSEYFTIGKKYEEVDLDMLGHNSCDETSVLLCSDFVTTDGHEVAMYVDLMDFEHVAMRQMIGLN